ncbi:putative 1,4-dihydroxy-2-naphthoate octaprenyltransferase [delta proteobacterium NaphS2]|nr:putative 1,4-dihydroxy-2-naphthoate octaprenyltransferase [delta proteobacterium NaphS2]
MSDIKTWFLAPRPWSFSMSAISVTIGSVWGLTGGFRFGGYLLALLGMVALHGATNLLNDYYDVKNEVDTPSAPTVKYRPHPLVENALNLRQVLTFSLLLYATGVVIGFYLTATRGWPILLIGMAGVLTAVFYTAPPFNLKYHALGEPAAFLMWGPLVMLGAHYVQTQTFDFAIVLISLPFGILVGLVLLANNIRDTAFDEKQGIKTLPVLLGGHRGRLVYGGLIFLAFFGVVIMSLLGPLTPWSLLVLLALPIVRPVFRIVSGDCPPDADARTAKLDTVFGVLLLISILLERCFS